LLALDATDELTLDAFGAREQCFLRPPGDPDADDNASPVELLPLAIQRHQGADFKLASRDVEAGGNPGPFGQVVEDFPFVVAVINDEKVVAGFLVSI